MACPLDIMDPHKYQEEVLKAIINRTLDDTAHRFIRAGTISAGGGMTADGGRYWPEIHNSLKKWEEAGFLTVAKDPEYAEKSEECVEMHQYIERKSPIPGFLNFD